MTISNANLYAHFANSFSSCRDKTVLTTVDDHEYTFDDLDRLSAMLANHLRHSGLRPGDRVTVQVGKSVQNLALYFATLRGGFVYQPLNPGYKRSEVEYFVANAEPSIVVCDSTAEPEMRQLAKAAGVPHLYTLDSGGEGSLMEAADGCSEDFDTVDSSKDDLAALLYSSGTTGVPKGIMLTHGNLLANTEVLVDAWGFTADDRLLHALPIFHVHGLFVAVGCVMLGGASMRWMSAYDARQIMHYLPECTVLMGVPTYYTRLLAEPAFSKETCRNTRLFISGSAPLLEETFAEFEARTGHRILERYGMTETNMNTSNPLKGVRKPGTVGLPLAGVELRVTDDDGRVVPTGEIGHLQLRGPNVFKGYWRMPDKTAEDFTVDGFFNTGDMGRIDEDGYVSIVGRNKDLVITGGLNVYPKEVELFIDDLPGVKESAIIGVPHADFGEGVVAIVVPESTDSTTEAAVLAACKERLANFKVPKRVVLVPELPRNTMAKVQKNLLRDTYADLLS